MSVRTALLVSTLALGQLVGQTSPTGSMSLDRNGHTATLLNSGLVLVAAGNTTAGYTNTAEIYNPQTGTWRYTGLGSQTSLNVARGYYTGTKLADGRVLLV